jgi:hypothetical protein
MSEVIMNDEKLFITTVRIPETLRRRMQVYIQNHDSIQEKFINRAISEKIERDSTNEQMMMDIDVPRSDVPRSGRSYFASDKSGDHS